MNTELKSIYEIGEKLMGEVEITLAKEIIEYIDYLHGRIKELDLANEQVIYTLNSRYK